MIAALSAWEVQALLWVQAVLRNPVTDPVVSLFTRLGDSGLMWILWAALLLLIPKTRRVGLAVSLGLICSLLFTNCCLKLIFQRVRPWVDFPALLPLVDAQGDPNSFPSGHASASFAFAAAFFRAAQKRWVKVVVFALAALMGLSRLYVGVHYPTDVLAGLLVGVLAGLVGWYLSTVLLKRFQDRQKKPPVT